MLRRRQISRIEAAAALGGEITLRGDVLTPEAEAVVAAAPSVRGVRDVLDDLNKYAAADGVPSLQGRIGEPPLDLCQRKWAPATRALVGMTAIAARRSV